MKHIIDDADKNKYEAYTKAETLAVIQEAMASGELPEEINGLVLTFKNPIDNKGYKIAFCTQAKYNELETAGTLEGDCLYYITDDTTLDDLNERLDTIDDTLEWVVEHINTGIKDALTSISCAFDFTDWATNTAYSFSSGSTINSLGLHSSSSYGYNQVNILPAGSNSSVANAYVEEISGDTGYIQYDLDAIPSGTRYYIEFTARNISNGYIYGPATSYGSTTKTTTFRITVVDVYGTTFTKDFTISFKV